MKYTIGVDLGQSMDYTAITITETVYKAKSQLYPQERWSTDALVALLTVRHIERLPLQTRYTEVVDKIVKYSNDPRLYGDVGLVVDEGQAGKPVLDMMIDAGLAPVGITITSGQNVNTSPGGFNVPKKDLVYNLVSLFLTGRIKFAQGLKFTSEIREELRNFQMKTTKAGNETWENSKGSIHDDLVMSLAMGAWYALEDLPPSQAEKQTTTEYDILDHGA